ncbi:hypothetical protein NMG60_11034947 [Bertholletia excelsa]
MDNSMEGITVKYAEQFLSPCSSNVNDVFGDPVVLPRVGDQYQAEIPPPWTNSKPTGSEAMVECPNYFALGLTKPIMWEKGEVKNIRTEALDIHSKQVDAVDKNWKAEVENCEEKWNTSNNQDGEVTNDPLYAAVDIREVGLSTLHPMTTSDRMDVDLDVQEENKIPLPGSLSQPWSAIEHNSFLLALYIFGKNLILVKRFVKSRRMGDILSHYYGKFYRSYEHQRWSDCRKMRNRRCIHGQKIFHGWRHQELLSRLFSRVPEDCQNMLREVCGAFGEGKILLEDYVFSLKDIVGINMLVEAVGIGKGKQDLTRTSMDHIKTNNLLSVRPEIPTGKACSSLTLDEIIKFLTGDFRLSKARSSDLFWEAVWPRLLARGWHSEQPKDHAFGSSKQSLVFLVPGVKKFSRRKLVKGNHYFDSVSDVLNKVASDPALLDVETEAAQRSGHMEGYQTDLPAEQNPDGLSNNKRHYLQPLTANCDRNLIKFTIVDTSLIHGGVHSKVRELRTLPVEPSNMPAPSDLSSDTEEGSSEESQNETEETNILNSTGDTTEILTNSSEIASIQSNGLPNGSDLTILAGENHEDWSTGMSSNKQLRGTTMKFQSTERVKSECSRDMAPTKKWQQITASSLGESTPLAECVSAHTNLNEEESPCCVNSPYTCEDTKFQVGPSQISSASSLAQGNQNERDQHNVEGNSLITEPSCKKSPPNTLINLNLPHVPQDLQTQETLTTGDAHKHSNSGTDRPLIISETSHRSSHSEVSGEHQPAVIGRRQSKRNRPLTTRALEAIACGFLSTTKRKRKCVESVDAQSQSDSVSRASQLVHGRPVVTSIVSASNDIAQPKIENLTNGAAL